MEKQQVTSGYTGGNFRVGAKVSHKRTANGFSGTVAANGYAVGLDGPNVADLIRIASVRGRMVYDERQAYDLAASGLVGAYVHGGTGSLTFISDKVARERAESECEECYNFEQFAETV